MKSVLVQVVDVIVHNSQVQFSGKEVSQDFTLQEVHVDSLINLEYFIVIARLPNSD